MTQLPVGACDCHMHVFDDRFPIVEGARPVPAASVDEYRAMRNRLGLTRTVVVAPSTYGLDNRCTLTALAALGAEARAVIAPTPGAQRAELEALHRAGVRGVRLNFARGKATPIETLWLVADQIAALGWHIQLMLTPEQLVTHHAAIERLPVPLVVDHMARIPQDGGVRSPAWPVLRGLLDAGRTWVKLSLASSARLLDTPAEAELHATGRALMAAASGRLVWGSDWPHVLATLDDLPHPSEERLLEVVLGWIHSDAERRALLVDTPATLYGFSTT